MTPPTRANPAPQPQNNSKSDEKPMSWFYLLQHYNKENAAIYKAQKEQQKMQQPVRTPPMMPPTQNAAPNRGIAIPGQQTAMPVQKPAPQPVQQAPAVKPAPQVPHQVSTAPSQQVPAQQQPRSINFGETTVLNGNQVGETTVLGVTAEPTHVEPYLLRVKNNEKIPLNKPVFRIGKERSYVDYFIGDNTAISRSHANIINDNGEYYVVDTNSTNHTYVNGGMIQSNVQTKLSHGTKLRFANEDFEFKMY